MEDERLIEFGHVLIENQIRHNIAVPFCNLDSVLQFMLNIVKLVTFNIGF